MKKTIFITGGAGYLGSVMVGDFLARGYRVRVLDNFRFGQTSLMGYAHSEDLEIVQGDIRDEKLVKKMLTGADLVIPLAAIVGAPACDKDPVGSKSINLDAPLMMFSLLSKSQKVLMPTTNSAYGSGNKDNFCDENSPLNPISTYAEWKVAVEKELLKLPHAISFRLATVFGASPRMRLDLLVNNFTYRALKDKAIVLFEANFKRNYIHVRDVSRVFQHGIDNFDQMNGQIYNVGLSTANLSKKELCLEIQKQVPGFVFFESEIGKDPDQRNYIVSNEKIEKTGFLPQYSVADGISELRKTLPMLNISVMGNVI